MKAKEKLVPELRFPEFTDEWEEKKLGEEFNFGKGKGIPKKKLSYEGNKCILYGQLYTIYKEIIEDVRNFTEIDIEKLVLSEYGDILLPSSGETALDMSSASAVLLDNIALGGDINILRAKSPNIDSKFMSYQINSVRQIDIARISEGSSVVHLYNSNLENLKAFFPSLPEQQKIGNFFYKIDKKLDLQRERIEELKDYKKAMMQRIFDQEIRFKDENGNEYPEWEEKRIGEVTEVISSSLRVSDLKEKGKTPVYDVLEKVGYTNKKGVNTDYISIIKDGSGVGRVKILPKESLFIATMNGIKVKEDNLYFVYLTLKNINFLKYIVGSGIPHIYYKDYSKEKIQLPSFPEQEKIANFLSAIDEKIELEEEKLEEFEKFKKGLMQRMFI